MIFNKSYSKVFFAVIVLSILGGFLRVVSCYWGYPLHLHPDERVIVDNAINMLSRHSWEAFVYNRPDQFEIKCNAILFTMVSWIKYHVPAFIAFKTHEIDFYLIARFYTAFFGIALIPLTVILLRKISETMTVNKGITQISGAFLIAFSPIFVTHSACATPDIPLTFFIVLFSYLFFLYIEKGEFKIYLLSCVTIGIGITIKYPAAILCAPLTIMVIYRLIVIDKNPAIVILNYAVKSILIICSIVFIIAPNLFTDLGKVYLTLLFESGPSHLGAEGLGFIGNLLFYLKTAIENIGWESTVLMCLGIYTLFSNQNRLPIYTFGIGIMYWICISALPLHWVRWGIPIFFFYNFAVAIGIGRLMYLLKGCFEKQKSIYYIVLCISSIISVAVLFNVVISGCAIAKAHLLTDTRLTALKYCKKHGITKENTIYETYTPFAPSHGYWMNVVRSFDLTKDGIEVKKKFKSKRYVMYSRSFRNRYFAREKEYVKEVNIFKNIEKSYHLVYQIVPDGNYTQKRIALNNILYSGKYLLSKYKTNGSIISIYRLR